MIAVRFLTANILLLGVLPTAWTMSQSLPGQPLAIRQWPGAVVSVETMADFKVAASLTGQGQLPDGVDVNLDDLATGEKLLIQRLANEDKPTIKKATGADAAALKANPDSFSLIAVADAQDNNAIVIMGTDVAVWLFKQPPSDALIKRALDGNAKAAKTLAVVIGNAGFDAAACQKIAEQVKPALMVVPGSIQNIGTADVQAIEHNTVAFSAVKQAPPNTRFVTLGDKPYVMSKELQTLFAKKEAACQASQDFFSGLSVAQMNFKPGNGTHTPRWNPEHMMGRELLFFSQIYHAADPAVPVMNLNPKQMPKDYQYAHPDWTGAEEARQMQRVTSFTRRFAYLLDAMDLDKQATGSRFWTPRRLLQQMERHYSEHTNNVKKKMKLAGWPEE